MIRRPPRSTRTDTLFPYTTLFRSSLATPLPDFVRGEAELTSAYGQLSVEPLNGLTLNGGVRYDDHDRYGGQPLFAAGGVWRLPSGTVLRARHGAGLPAHGGPGERRVGTECGSTWRLWGGPRQS